jgi:DNA-directed RNA polymerase specialized sigma24 family protein
MGHRDRIYGTLTRMNIGHEDAEDIIQDTFLKMLQQNIANPKKLYQIAKNKGNTLMRQKEREISLGSLELYCYATPRVRLQEAELEQRYRHARRQLADPQRLVLDLSETLTLADIAQTTKVPLGSVKSKLHYTRKLMHAEFMKTGSRKDYVLPYVESQ